VILRTLHTSARNGSARHTAARTQAPAVPADQARVVRRSARPVRSAHAARREHPVRRPLRAVAIGTLVAAAIATPIASQAAFAGEVSATVQLAAARAGMVRAAHPGVVGTSIPEQAAADALATAQQTVQQVQGKADTTALTQAIDGLQSNTSTNVDTVEKLTDVANSAIAIAQAAAAGHDAGTAVANAAAAQAAAEAAAAAQAAAVAQANANTPAGAQATAQSMMSSQYGWGADQFQCLVSLWTKESGWNYQAENGGSGAYGIPQALPGSKMAANGSDWATNASTQVAWGLAYIASAYGSPCAAWSHSEADNWY
jgi:hypothetical protein